MTATFEDRIQGITTSVAVKAPVRVATTANITLSGLQAIDGVTVVANDRVLVKNQTNTVENGIYKADTSSWSRAEDFDGSGDAVKGTRVWIIEGSAQAGQEWNLTTADTVVIGTSNIVWAQSPLQDAVAAAQAAQAAAEAAAAGVDLPSITGGDAGKALKVNAGETAFDLTGSALGTAALLDVGAGANNIVQRDGSGNYPAGDGSALTNVASDFPAGHLFGLALSNATDAAHDIQIATGECRDAAGTVNLSLASALTKEIDASWAEGSNAGGRFNITLENNTWYHVFLIRKDSDGTIDGGFDTSISAANIPGGYTAYRRLGSVRTDGSANILAFTQNGDWFRWTTLTEDWDTTGLGTTESNFTPKVPTGLSVLALGNVYISNASNPARVYIRHPDETNATPTVDGPPLGSIASPASNDSVINQVQAFTNTSGQLRASAAHASTTVRYVTVGWFDTRGRLG